MRCYCVTEFGRPLVAMDCDLPEPTGDEVLVRVKGAGVCHSDLHLWEGGYDLGNGRILSLKDRGTKLPLALGHEIAGEAIAAGPQATRIEAGRNYLVYPWIGCGECSVCRAGNENLCAKAQFLGVARHGGYAEHVLVPRSRYLLDLGDIDPAEAAPYACSGVTTYSALKKAGRSLYEKPIVIIGAGGLGLMCLAILKGMGGAGAIVVELDPAKREAALKAGAKAAIDGASPDAAAQIAAILGEQASVAIDLVGAPATASLGFDCLEKGGKLIIVGLFGGSAPWPLPFIPMRGITIVGSLVGNLTELTELMALVRAGKVPPIPVTRMPLSAANDALTMLRDGKVVGRTVLTPA
ncbi:alcohol dehydrogenase [Enterovirga sp. CN4-39]|uniref:alcohol dehydrogenase n=1 Tax=Enterovirga sp. CN4-39 TaxID=3400910 RepID=UPI003C1234FE